MLQCASHGIQAPPSPSSFRNAVYSTPRDFASPVSGRTLMLSLRKFSKTWRKGKSHPRGLPASLVLERESSRVPGPQQCAARGSWPAGFCGLAQRWGQAGSRCDRPCFWAVGSRVCSQRELGSACSSNRARSHAERAPRRQTPDPSAPKTAAPPPSRPPP